MKMKWKCPNGCTIEKGVVCGGDYPFYIRDTSQIKVLKSPHLYPNMYFLMDLTTEEFLKEPYGGERGFELSGEDWVEMFCHAEGGCAGEPQCPKCLEYLVEISIGK